MPYRRFPATDAARIRALKTILDNDDVYTVKNRVVDWKTLSRAKTVYDNFSRALDSLHLSRRCEVKADSKYKELFQRARMFVSHFIQVLHMAMQRGEIRVSAQSLYGMQEDDFSVPEMLTERQLIEWGERVINGERERLKTGGVPIYNPNIAKVAVHYDLFREAWQRRHSLMERSDGCRDKVAALRGEVDSVLQDLWNGIEQHFADLPPEQRYDACRKCGVIYYYRRGEAHIYG